MLRQLGAEVVEVRVPADLDGLDGLVIPGGESTTISMGIDVAGLEPADPGSPRSRPADLRHLRRDDPLRRRRTWPDRRDASSATPSAASCTASRPTSRSMASATSRCARSSSGRPGSSAAAPGWRCSPPTKAIPWRSAKAGAGLRLPPGADRRSATACLFMAMTTSCASERRRRRRRERSEGGEPGEDPGRLLDRGEGRARSSRSTASAAPSRCCAPSTRRC